MNGTTRWTRIDALSPVAFHSILHATIIEPASTECRKSGVFKIIPWQSLLSYTVKFFPRLEYFFQRRNFFRIFREIEKKKDSEILCNSSRLENSSRCCYTVQNSPNARSSCVEKRNYVHSAKLNIKYASYNTSTWPNRILLCIVLCLPFQLP